MIRSNSIRSLCRHSMKREFIAASAVVLVNWLYCEVISQGVATPKSDNAIKFDKGVVDCWRMNFSCLDICPKLPELTNEITMTIFELMMFIQSNHARQKDVQAITVTRTSIILSYIDRSNPSIVPRGERILCRLSNCTGNATR